MILFSLADAMGVSARASSRERDCEMRSVVRALVGVCATAGLACASEYDPVRVNDPVVPFSLQPLQVGATIITCNMLVCGVFPMMWCERWILCCEAVSPWQPHNPAVRVAELLFLLYKHESKEVECALLCLLSLAMFT